MVVMLWLRILPLAQSGIFICFIFVIINYHTPEKKFQTEPKVKLNHNIYFVSTDQMSGKNSMQMDEKSLELILMTMESFGWSLCTVCACIFSERKT